MTPRPTNDFFPIFENGQLRPGIYKMQNIESETFLDIEIHTREVCCRSANDLGEGRGFWEIKRFGAGCTVQAVPVEPGEPEQFCTSGGNPGDSILAVSPYPAGWRVETVDNGIHRGFNYVRFYWGTTNFAWLLDGASQHSGAKVWSWPEDERPRLMWKMIPVRVENAAVPPPPLFGNPGLAPPPHDGAVTEQTTTRTQHIEPGDDELGTVVNEVTVVTTNSTITTRKRYRVAEP